jgi:23S rRNA pseudouridine1911/1915/1917 synthase
MSENIEMLRFMVSEEFDGQRVDKFLTHVIENYSRASFTTLFAKNKVFLEDEEGFRVIRKSRKIWDGQTIVVEALPEKEASFVEPEEMDLDIRYQDDDLIVLHKPRGLVVHPGSGISKGTLAGGLLHHFKILSDMNGPLRPGIVHRLDKDTAGLMLVARNDKAHTYLSGQLQDRTLKRVYHAIVWGQPKPEGIIDRPLGRDVKNRLRQRVTSEGREARTHYKVLKYFPGCALVELRLETGRTHQIRVHMNSIGNPVLGDPLYSGRDERLAAVHTLYKNFSKKALSLTTCQALQAVELSFLHPKDDIRLSFTSEIDGEFKTLLEYLEPHVLNDLTLKESTKEK